MSKAEASDSLPGRERRGATAALRTILRAIIALRAVKKPSWSASGAERMRAPIAVLAGCGYLPARVDHLERQAHESVHTSAWFCYPLRFLWYVVISPLYARRQQAQIKTFTEPLMCEAIAALMNNTPLGKPLLRCFEGLSCLPAHAAEVHVSHIQVREMGLLPKPKDAEHYLAAMARFEEGSMDWAEVTARFFHAFRDESCSELPKPEWWNDEGLKALSARVVHAAPDGIWDGRVVVHEMRALVLSLVDTYAVPQPCRTYCNVEVVGGGRQVWGTGRAAGGAKVADGGGPSTPAGAWGMGG